MIALALASGIAPGVWAQEGERAIVTAIGLLNKQHAKTETRGPQYSG